MKLALDEAPNSLTLSTAPLVTWLKDGDGHLWYRTGVNFVVRVGNLRPHYESDVHTLNLDGDAALRNTVVRVLPPGSEITITV